MTIWLPLWIKTKDNQRGHWSKRSKTSQIERRAAWLSVHAERSTRPEFPVRVTITRCGPRTLDPTNMGSACKSLIDGIADAYGVDDRDLRWQWDFRQRKQSTYGVEIQIEGI